MNDNYTGTMYNNNKIIRFFFEELLENNIFAARKYIMCFNIYKDEFYNKYSDKYDGYFLLNIFMSNKDNYYIYTSLCGIFDEYNDDEYKILLNKIRDIAKNYNIDIREDCKGLFTIIE